VSTRVFFDKPLNAFMGAGGLGARISDFDGDMGLTGDEDGLLRVGMIALSSNGDGPITSFGITPRGASKSNWAGVEEGGPAMEGSLRRHRNVRRASCLSPELHGPRSHIPIKFGDPLLRFTLEWTDHEFKQREFTTRI
jgi:hypothetical protein